ncbi:MAG: Gx transporter family protein [Bacillota bacterium]
MARLTPFHKAMQNTNTSKPNAKKTAVLALLSCLALISFIIESALPVLFPYMPYAKLGVANIFIMLAVVIFGIREGVVVAVTKLLLSAMITGNIYGCLYSACGLILSLSCLAILIKFPLGTTIIGKSILSSVFFNIGQVIFASVSLSYSLIAILPVMLFCSVIAGSVIGIAVKLVIKRIPSEAFNALISA